MAEAVIETADRKKSIMRRVFDAFFLVGFLASLIPGPFPQYSAPASVILLVCIAVSFFDENFYVYAALFMYLRYRLVIGDTPAFRVYSYMLVLRFLFDLPKIKFKISYLPALFVFLLHSIFATGRFESMRVGLNVIVDCAISYVILCRVLPDKRLFRKFIFVFMLGGIASGIYGWTNDIYTVDINVSGAGAHEVSRNFGALSDSNFAGLFYSMCIICSVTLAKIPKWMRCVFVALFTVMLLQTASLSAILTLAVLIIFLIILKYRMKSIFILLISFVACSVIIAFLLSIPQFRQIEAISGLLIRFSEKLSYISRGRWDLLTTERYTIWQEALGIFTNKSLWGKLIGGNVITVMALDESVISIAIHNSYLQSILNFGVIGALLVYIPLFAEFIYKMLGHFTKPDGYEYEDTVMLQLLFLFSFIVFGGTVDFFIDWAFMIFYFM